MAKVELLAVSDLQIEGVLFPSTVANPPGSSKSLFLAGAGVRSLQIEGKEIKFTSIGIYLEATALQTLAPTWKSKTSEELAESPDFFKQIVSGNFEKFIRVTMILPLTGKQYSDKVAENCVAYWKAMGIYTEAEAEAVEKFKEAFKEENFPPGSSILFTQSPSGTLTISFSTGSKEEGIENAAMAMAVLESIIGEHGVSPAAKRSLASRISELLKEVDGGGGGVEVAVENGGVAVKEDGGE